MVDIQAFVSTPETVVKKRLTLKVSESTQQALHQLKTRIKRQRRQHPDAPTVNLEAAIEQAVLEVITSTDTLYDTYQEHVSSHPSSRPSSAQHPAQKSVSASNTAAGVTQ